jgi:hypothetical protein
MTTIPVAEARREADRLYGDITTCWGHIVGHSAGGHITAANLMAGTAAANTEMQAIEAGLTRFLSNVNRWGAAGNYNPTFIVNVTFWSTNLRTSAVNAAQESVRGRGNPDDVAEAIRGTLEYVKDPYNFRTFAPLPPLSKKT